MHVVSSISFKKARFFAYAATEKAIVILIYLPRDSGNMFPVCRVPVMNANTRDVRRSEPDSGLGLNVNT